jgi:hypothetical protein
LSSSDDLIRTLALRRVLDLRNLWGDSIPESELRSRYEDELLEGTNAFKYDYAPDP